MDTLRSEPGTHTAVQVDESRYRLWLEWVTINLGRDPYLASLAARAATEASLQGAGFQAGTEAARTAWHRGKSARSRRSIDGLEIFGYSLAFGSIALVALFVGGMILLTMLSSFADCGGPIVLCPDMCGGRQVEVPYSPSPSAAGFPATP